MQFRVVQAHAAHVLLASPDHLLFLLALHVGNYIRRHHDGAQHQQRQKKHHRQYRVALLAGSHNSLLY